MLNRLPFHTVKNIGFGFLFCLLATVVLLSYQHHRHFAIALTIITDELSPNARKIEHINQLMSTANHQFQLFRHMEQLSDEDVLTPLQALRKKTKFLEKLLTSNDLAFTPKEFLGSANIIYGAFLRHLDEIDNTGDQSNDNSVILLALIEKNSIDLAKRLRLLHAEAGAIVTAVGATTSTANRKSVKIIVDPYRYLLPLMRCY